MTSCGSNDALGGQELKERLAKAIDFFSDHVEEINQLNVFPVPDGDTGINLYHTLRRAYREVASLETASVSQVMRSFALGSLMGARGNSGTILSQLFKGFAQGLGNADSLTSDSLAVACQRAVELAYAAVSQPVEGTILTVARESAESVNRNGNAKLGLAEIFGILLRAAERSLADTPNKLPILREAGVVDAGAMGLVVFLRGLAAERAAQAGDSSRGRAAASRMRQAKDMLEDPHFGYDVQFLMRGEGLEIGAIRQDLEQMGWSVLVVGDPDLLKVHIHVDNPALPLDYAIQSGAELDDIVVENMQAQFQRQAAAGKESKTKTESRQIQSEFAVVAVAQGDGLRAIFDDLGCAETIAGGQGRNPSVEDFVEVIRHLPAKRVILLPNNRNLYLSARQAVEFFDGVDARALRTETMLQGISAMIAFGDAVNGDIAFDELLSRMQSAANQLVSIEISRADRSGSLNKIGFERGEFIAIVDGELRAAAMSAEDAIVQGLRTIDSDIAELATIYYGEGVSERDAIQLIERLSCAATGLQFEVVYGGQSIYPYLIGVE